MNYKVAVIGHQDLVAIYRMLGVDCVAAATQSEARIAIDDLIRQTHEGTELPLYGVIFIEETLHADLPPELIEKLTKRALPALIPVPTPSSVKGAKSYGIKRLSSIVERAIGSDILS